MHMLDITGKHQNIISVGTVYENLIVNLMHTREGRHSIDFEAMELKPSDRQYPLRDGEEVFRIKAAVSDTEKWGFKPNYEFKFLVAFGEKNIAIESPYLTPCNDSLPS